MSMTRSGAFAGVAMATFAVMVGGMGLAACRPAPASQPLPFNHKKHIDKNIECIFCHEKAAKGSMATLPDISVCMSCHSNPQGTSPVEQQVRDVAAAGQEFPWVQVNRLPGHVYFSHRAHVKWGQLDCSTCHGNMKDQVEPVTESQIGGLTMTKCISCHKERSARTDCLTCHK